MYRADNNNRIMYRLLRTLCAFYCLALAGRTSSAENIAPNVFENCGNLSPQGTIEMPRITGVWYVIETIQHKTDERYHGENFEEATCPSIYLTYANEHNETNVKLFWQLDDYSIEYQFRMIDVTSPGTWTSVGAQNGSLEQLSHNQFAGLVIVRKVVNDHMWLLFCSPNEQLYSLLVSRVTWLDTKELMSIIKLMGRQGIPITQRKQTCKSSSSSERSTIWLTVVAAALCLRLSVLAYKTN